MKIVMPYNIQLALCCGLTCATKQILCKRRSKSEVSLCTNCTAWKMEPNVNSVSERDRGNLPTAKSILLSDQCNFKTHSSFLIIASFCIEHLLQLSWYNYLS